MPMTPDTPQKRKADAEIRRQLAEQKRTDAEIQRQRAQETAKRDRPTPEGEIMTPDPIER